MAPTEAECREIVTTAGRYGVMLCVCHVLHYTPHTQAVKKLLNGGAIGEIVSVQHLEPVGFWHMAHLSVRGQWRATALSSPMLLAKPCHDLDWLRYMIGLPCQRVSSFGNLKHFCREYRPPGASDCCLDCPPEVEEACPFSATRIYLGQFLGGNKTWPVNVVTPKPTLVSLSEALRVGPYGSC